jgi:hypothetical protein
MASTYLQRTQGTGTSRDIWTLSMWVKRSGLGSIQGLMSTAGGWDDGTGMAIVFNADDVFNVYNPSQGGGGGNYNVGTRKYRDTNAWYHIVFRADSSQGTQADRMKIYINGVQDTTINTGNYPSQNTDWNNVNNNGQTLQIGRAGSVGSTFFDGIMSHVHFADGQSLAPTVFGETDATTGEWKINTSPSFTLGTNGFTILKDGNTITDQSSNSNDFTLGGGTLTKTEDCPSDVFATLNPLNVPTSNAPTFTNGNTTTESATTTGQRFMGSSTLGATKGKYYAECRVKVIDSLTSGVSPDVSTHARDNTYFGSHAHDASITFSTGNKYINDSGSTHGDAFSVDDILMIALDLDNNNVYFGRNGNWFDGSGNADEAAPNSAISLTAPASTPDGAYFFGSSDGGGSAKAKCEWNFGNGYFGTTAVSSAGTNASNIGIFEHDVPTGFTALSTKGLNN